MFKTILEFFVHVAAMQIFLKFSYPLPEGRFLPQFWSILEVVGMLVSSDDNRRTFIQDTYP